MTAFARSFAGVLWVTAVVAAAASSYLDQSGIMATVVRVYAYGAGALGGLFILLTLPRMAMPLPAPRPTVARPPLRRTMPQPAAVPVVQLKPRQTFVPAVSADDPDALRARARRLFGTVA
ncbi:MAG: hypothetical protein JF571_06400 [Asticcacaulis sp.]|nr:hypothetical protein [Asticcacaulis sp.]